MYINQFEFIWGGFNVLEEVLWDYIFYFLGWNLNTVYEKVYSSTLESFKISELKYFSIRSVGLNEMYQMSEKMLSWVAAERSLSSPE